MPSDHSILDRKIFISARERDKLLIFGGLCDVLTSLVCGLIQGVLIIGGTQHPPGSHIQPGCRGRLIMTASMTLMHGVVHSCMACDLEAQEDQAKMFEDRMDEILLLAAQSAYAGSDNMLRRTRNSAPTTIVGPVRSCTGDLTLDDTPTMPNTNTKAAVGYQGGACPFWLAMGQ